MYIHRIIYNIFYPYIIILSGQIVVEKYIQIFLSSLKKNLLRPRNSRFIQSKIIPFTQKYKIKPYDRVYNNSKK